MTQTLFRDDSYRAEVEAIVLASEPRGIALDRTVFYAQGGGQSGDKGTLLLDDGTLVPIVSTIYDANRATILHVRSRWRRPAPLWRSRHRPHRLGAAVQAHARPIPRCICFRSSRPIRSREDQVGDAEGAA